MGLGYLPRKMIYFLNRFAVIGAVALTSCGMISEGRETEIFGDTSEARLAAAACEGSSDQVLALSSSGADPNYAGRDGITPLIYAIGCKNDIGVTALLSAGADPNQQADKFLLPLSVAATQENSEIVQRLLDAGASVDGVTGDVEGSPLLRALSFGIHNEKWQNYKIILDRGANINLAYGPNKITAPVRAVGSGRFNIALDLLNRGYSHELENLRSSAELRVANESQEKFKFSLIEEIDRRLAEEEH